MLSIKPLGKAGSDAAKGASTYYEGLAREDYYEKGGEPPGRWMGRLADDMGLQGNVKDGQLKAMFEGFHPETGEQLAKNAGEEHKAGWDLAFSAPKSVSSVWAVADESTRAEIQAAQDKAVKASLAFLEQHAFSTRDRQGSAQADKLLAAAYPHSTSREQDPQLHTHLLVANLTQRVDGSWAALDFDTRWKMAAGAVYRAELAAQMQAMGFQTERDNDSFKVAGVPAGLVEEFSKRRQQIEAVLEEKGYSSAKAAEVAALSTRATKEPVSREELFRQWRETALAHGFTPESVAQLRLPAQALQEKDEAAQAQEEVDPLSNEAIFAALTEHDSAFTVHKIYQAVAVAAQGRLDAEQVETRVKDLLADPDMVKLRKKSPEDQPKDKRNPRANERHYSTREMIDLEEAMAARAGQLATKPSHEVRHEAAEAAMKAYELEKGFQLSAEQRSAVLHITAGSGQLAAVRGAAGAGKTTFMEPARTAWESAGYRVRGAALAGKAAAGMEAVGIKSQTVHSLLHELDGGWLERLQKLEDNAATADKAVAETLAAGCQPSEKLLAWQASTHAELAEHKAREVTACDVILVDEAGMVGSRHMARLLEHAEKIGFKLVLVGDEKQLQAVAAGGAFQVAQKQAGYAELSDNRRQRDAADREAASAVVEGRAGDALKSYLDRGRIHIEADQTKTAQQMVSAWAACSGKHKDKLMLAKTRAEVGLLNNLARADMKAGGRLCNEVSISATAGRRELAEGDRILFTKNDRTLGVKNGHLGTIERIDFDPSANIRLAIRMDHDGSLVMVTPDAIQGKQREAYNHIEYGYAVTTHKAQGVTVDHAFVLGLGNKEMGYVQMTRHRETCELFMTAKEIDQLEEAAEEALFEEFGDIEATEKMLDYMQMIAEKRGIEPSKATDFVSVRMWLDRYSDKELGLEPRSGPEQQDFVATDPDLIRLRGIVNTLAASHQKGTTLDYVEEEGGAADAGGSVGAPHSGGQRPAEAQALEDEIPM
jgi:conjugative relaxase-like TrwC/TraI family protein